MTTRDLNKEAFLWYTLTSPEYMDRSYAKLTEAAEFLRQQIKQYEEVNRYPPVPRWLGEMEKLEASYADARARLAHGDYGTMAEWAGALKNIPRGFSEAIMTWMDDGALRHFEEVLDRAYSLASGYMRAIQMSMLYFSDPREQRIKKDQGFAGASISLPLRWETFFADVTEIPEYSVDVSLSCTTGERVPWTGIWIPNHGPGSAALAFARQNQFMQPAYEVFPDEQYPDFDQTRPVDVTWYPLRPTGRMVPVSDGAAANDPMRVPAGKPATRNGYWHTPAKQNSRRYFKQGDVFPEIEGSSYGATFWQWSPDQSAPSL